ncbi:hypothetical protein A3J90_03870 [candidate division WOR-1 bacterium RIFOXYC2_FULL_37_10]|nr:MAG: hypothetical protein A3J90_03870 [candidate division WOR-1 bacterium RIFOXYC2_FULL_37_10]
MQLAEMIGFRYDRKAFLVEAALDLGSKHNLEALRLLQAEGFDLPLPLRRKYEEAKEASDPLDFFIYKALTKFSPKQRAKAISIALDLEDFPVKIFSRTRIMLHEPNLLPYVEESVGNLLASRNEMKKIIGCLRLLASPYAKTGARRFEIIQFLQNISIDKLFDDLIIFIDANMLIALFENKIEEPLLKAAEYNLYTGSLARFLIQANRRELVLQILNTTRESNL